MSDESRMVKDPICGKEVDTLRARAVGIFGGVTYYFCSQECKGRFVDPRQSTVDRRQPTAEERKPPEAEPEAPPVQYARSRVRRVTGDIGTPVVQIDLSPERRASDEPESPARSGRGWAWIAIVMLILAGGVIFYTIEHR